MRRAAWLLALAPLLAAAPAPAAVDARLEGTLRMDGRITIARDVRGERAGQRVVRAWRVDSTCPTGVCRRVTLRRPRPGGEDRLVLVRVRRGVWRARGAFTIPLRCGGRTYRGGGLVPFTVTLTVARAAVVQTTPFATGVSATYDNPRRVNRTPCPGGLGRDAARYTGVRVGPLPVPPQPEFAAQVLDPVARRVAFAATAPATGVVSFGWDFGDPASGAADLASGPRAEHVFTAPGARTVTLTALDGNGLSGSAAQVLAF